MNRNTLKLAFLTALTLVVLGASSASANASTLYVSAQTGSDANNGQTPATATRTISKAISLNPPTKSNIVLLDSGTYDTFAITYPLTIEAAPGATAVIPQATGFAAASIYVNSPDTAIVRGLTFTGGLYAGIYCGTGTVIVENCVVSNFSSYGIYSDGAGLLVKDTAVRNCGNGIFVSSSQPSVANVVTIEHCRLEKNGIGLFAYTNSRVTVRDSVASNNTNSGFQAATYGTSSCDLTIENSLANGNNTGVFADNSWSATVTVRVSNSTATGNQTGFKQTSGTTFSSRGNNTVQGNTSNLVGTISVISGS